LENWQAKSNKKAWVNHGKLALAERKSSQLTGKTEHQMGKMREKWDELKTGMGQPFGSKQLMGKMSMGKMGERESKSSTQKIHWQWSEWRVTFYPLKRAEAPRK